VGGCCEDGEEPLDFMKGGHSNGFLTDCQLSGVCAQFHQNQEIRRITYFFLNHHVRSKQPLYGRERQKEVNWKCSKQKCSVKYSEPRTLK
jgi:hypothetical protein